MMHISFNTDELTAEDRQVLALLAGTATAPAQPATPAKASPAAKPTPAKPAAPKEELKPEPVVEPEPETAPEVEEDLVGGSEPEPEGPTMADAVAAATKLVSSGGAAKVKEALAAVGAKRVSEISVDSIAAFLDALK